MRSACESKNAWLIGVAFANAAGNKLLAETSRSGATNEDTHTQDNGPSEYDLESGLEERRIHVFRTHVRYSPKFDEHDRARRSHRRIAPRRSPC